MFLPLRLLAKELQRHCCLTEYLKYQKHLQKVENCNQRIAFLQKCKHSDIIPSFLKFRIPNNGCFDDGSVHEFQRKLLQKELIQAKKNYKELMSHLNEKREILKSKLPQKCVASVVVYSRIFRWSVRKKVKQIHDKKLTALAVEQSKPLFKVNNTVRLYNIDTPPQYVVETLSLGPKNPVLNKFEQKDILMELDCFF